MSHFRIGLSCPRSGGDDRLRKGKGRRLERSCGALTLPSPILVGLPSGSRTWLSKTCGHNGPSRGRTRYLSTVTIRRLVRDRTGGGFFPAILRATPTNWEPGRACAQIGAGHPDYLCDGLHLRLFPARLSGKIGERNRTVDPGSSQNPGVVRTVCGVQDVSPFQCIRMSPWAE